MTPGLFPTTENDPGSVSNEGKPSLILYGLSRIFLSVFIRWSGDLKIFSQIFKILNKYL